MVDIADLARQLEMLTKLQTIWCVGPADQSSMVVWYDHTTSLNPEGAARDWLAATTLWCVSDQPALVVFKSEFYSDTDEKIRAIAQQLRCISAAAATDKEDETS